PKRRRGQGSPRRRASLALAVGRASCDDGGVIDSPKAPRGIPSSWLRTLVLPLIVLAWLALLVLCLWVLSHFTRTILLVVLAAVLAFAFAPLANLLGRWVPRPIAIGLAYLLGVSVVFGFGAYVV